MTMFKYIGIWKLCKGKKISIYSSANLRACTIDTLLEIKNKWQGLYCIYNILIANDAEILLCIQIASKLL